MTTEQLKINIRNEIRGMSLYVMIRVLADKDERKPEV
jgi:hypothetical protein